MAVYTVLDKRELAEVVEDYGLVKLNAATGVANGSVNTTYLLETPRGKHLLRVDEVKGELEVKRELDLLLFLRKHGFPCPQPLADRKGRHYREFGGKCLSLYRWYDEWSETTKACIGRRDLLINLGLAKRKKSDRTLPASPPDATKPSAS